MKNKQRDINISNYYTGEGWSILRVWEHEIRSDFNTAIEKITDFINLAKSKESFL